MKRTKITPPQLAQLWGVSPGKIIAFINSGELRAVNLAKSRQNRPRYAIDVRDIESFERAREVIPNGGESSTRRPRRPAASEVKKFF